MASQLRLVANLWTLDGHPSSDREWTVPEKIDAAKAAGFNAITGDIGKTEAFLASNAGLIPIGFFWVHTERDAEEGVRQLSSLGLRWATVFIGSHDTPPEVTLRLALRLSDCARDAGIHAAVETHRNTGTETVEKLSAVLRGFREQTGRELPVTWDFSHYALGKHLAPDSWTERLIVPFQENIVQTRLFHFRPFNGHHCQLPVRVSGRRIVEYETFLAFVASVFNIWKGALSNKDSTMYVCPEIGPLASGYSLSHDPPSWQEALALAGDLRSLWDGCPESQAPSCECLSFPP